MKKMNRLVSALLALLLAMGISAAGAETADAERLKNYETFEDVAIYAEIPDSIMYVTQYSDESAPMYKALAQAGYSYDDFRELMIANGLQAYGVFLTDGQSEFQIAAGRVDADRDLTKADDAELQEMLELAGSELEGIGARIEERGIYRGENYNGFWFHMVVEAGGASQNVIQYSLFHSDRAVNIRCYNINGEYPQDAEEIIRGIFDSVIVN